MMPAGHVHPPIVITVPECYVALCWLFLPYMESDAPWVRRQVPTEQSDVTLLSMLSVVGTMKGLLCSVSTCPLKSLNFTLLSWGILLVLNFRTVNQMW